MKRVLFWLVLIVPFFTCRAQTPSCNWKQTVTAAGAGTSNANNTSSPNCNAFALTWTSTGFSAVTIQLEGSNTSASGFTAFSGTSTVIAGTANPTTALSGAIIVQAQTKLAYIRFNVPSVTGSGTISTQIYGYNGVTAAASAASSGGGTVTSVTASAPITSSGGTTPNISATYQGTSPSKIQGASGTTTSGAYPKYDATGNLIDSGVAAGNATNVNGASVPASAAAVATNASGQLIVANLTTTDASTKIASAQNSAPTTGHCVAWVNGDVSDFGKSCGDMYLAQNNVVLSSFKLDMSAAIGTNSLIVPVQPGLTVSVPGSIGYDSTVDAWHASVGTSDAKLPVVTINPTNDNCVKWVTSGTGLRLGDTGTPCGSGTGTVTTVTATAPLASSGGTTPDLSCATCVTGTPTNHGVALGSSTQAVSFTGAGTAGQALLSNGPGSDPSFQALPSSGALVLLEQHTASSSASLDFTTCISSTYDDYVIRLVNVLPASAGVNTLLGRFSTNGGSSYDSGTNYEYMTWYNSTGVNQGSNSATSVTAFQLVGTSISSTTLGVSGQIDIPGPLSASLNKAVLYHLSYFHSSLSAIINQEGAGRYTSNTAVNAFQFLFNSGNIASGTIRCYGIAK